MIVTEKAILDILEGIQHPSTKEKLSVITKIEGISTSDNLLKIRLNIKNLESYEKKDIRTKIEEIFTNKGIDALISITSSKEEAPHSQKTQIKSFLPEGCLDRFKKIVAVYSTKGGVGKSTIAANLAYELSKQGLKIAVVDLDIFGPSMPRILGMKEQVVIHEQKFVPAEIDGIHMMSVGLLIPSLDSPLVWRAPVVNGVISQIFTDTMWDNEYDMLILDMPPGTGDIPIVVGQSIPPHGIVAVSTPQGVALEDTVKGLSMFKKFNIPILGFVYNMGTVICDDCQKQIPLFKKTGEFDQFIEQNQIEVLTELPLDPRVTELADKGELNLIEDEWLWKKEFNKVIQRVVEKLELLK